MEIQEQFLTVGRQPAVLYGTPSSGVCLFIHGKCGNKEEAKFYAESLCPKGWQVLGIDLPGHGARTAEAAQFDPWHVVPELRETLREVRARWRHVMLCAHSIGAWFSMLAFAGEQFEHCLFISPIVDMECLIEKMMGWAGVTAAELEARQTIETAFGETLSWPYYEYVRAHPVGALPGSTAILYAGGDHLTARGEIEAFTQKFGCTLAVMEDGEHWFHTDEQLAVLRRWVEEQTEPVETAVVAALIWDGERFLICRRPAHKARGLLWEFVGGKVEPGESGPQALVRECKEELDVTVCVGEPFMEVVHTYPDLTVRLTLYHASIEQGMPRLLEHVDLRWITPAEIDGYEFCPADKEILERIKKL